jgi:GR25 family glycosyltransferase involved in LPS biosynthesis
MEITIAIVCHTETIVYECLKKYPNAYIFLVGSSGYVKDPRVIVTRDLLDNIESEPKLLTFTVWYAIVKNNLFINSNYICILEYDVIVDNYFFNNLENVCITNKYDTIAFLGSTKCFFNDINKDIFQNFLDHKEILYDTNKYWYWTTNQCIRRSILVDFVDWYYPACFIIKKGDLLKFSWYHERLFSVYIDNKRLAVTQIEGLKHLQLNSHGK